MRAQSPPPEDGGDGRGRRTLVAFGAGILGFFALAAIFGGQGGGRYNVTCKPASRAILDAVASGLTTSGPGSLPQGRLGTVEGSAGTYLVAEIDASGIQGRGQFGVWWLGDAEGIPGSIFAIDGLAREFSDWGAAARPGSPADESRKRRVPEALAVKDQCKPA